MKAQKMKNSINDLTIKDTGLPNLIIAKYSFNHFKLNSNIMKTLSTFLVALLLIPAIGFAQSETASLPTETKITGEEKSESMDKKAALTEAEKEEEEGLTSDETYSASHYFVNNSGYGLRKGQAYYENIYVLYNSVSYGVTDNFSISTGLEVGSLLFASEFPVITVSPKLSFPFKNDSGAFALSSTFLTTSFGSGFTTVGLLQGHLTLGNRFNNVTIGSGFGFSFEDGVADGVLPIQLGAMVRIKDNLSLVTDNNFFTGDGFFEGVYSLGLRVHSKKNNNFLTAGLWRVTEDTGPLIAIPFVSGTVVFK